MSFQNVGGVGIFILHQAPAILFIITFYFSSRLPVYEFG